MIRAVSKTELPACAALIRESFQTIADTFGLTRENAPRHTAFATTTERLLHHFEREQRPIYAYYDGEQPVGYYSLLLLENHECELNNLCVAPSHRHRGIGETLLAHAVQTAETLDCTKIKIGIVEENAVLKQWYARFGFLHTGTKKFDFFPFTCGYMEKSLH